MNFAKWALNICITFFIGLAVYFKIAGITSYDSFDGDSNTAHSIITWQTLLFFAGIMIVCRIFVQREDRKQKRFRNPPADE